MESPLREGRDDPDLRLIETFRSDASSDRIGRHLARMARGAAALGWRFDDFAARGVLAPERSVPVRMRLTLDRHGHFGLTTAPLPAPAQVWRVGLSAIRLRSDDPWLRVKSSRRAAYDDARAALRVGLDEAVLLNERDEVCDGTITTVFFDRGQGMRTPPLSCGLLPGILRETLDLPEEVLPAADLPRVQLWVGNSIRGLIPAIWAG